MDTSGEEKEALNHLASKYEPQPLLGILHYGYYMGDQKLQWTLPSAPETEPERLVFR